MLAYLLEYNRFANFFGIAAIIAIAFLFSKNKRAVNWRLVVNGLLMQFAIALAVLKFPVGKSIIAFIARCVTKLYQFADEGSAFVFGNLTNADAAWGFIFAVKVLPIIIFFGALMSLLFHLGFIQPVVGVVSKLVRPLLGTSGAESLCAISNSFLGQTEAPLLIRHYLSGMTKSEMLVVMISGMGTISGAILVVFAAMGVPAQHLLSASVMAIPATIVIAKILLPETATPQTAAGANPEINSDTGNTLDAIAKGTSDGMMLALNVGAMLISFLALIALVNYSLSFIGSFVGFQQLSLGYIFAYAFAPFGWLLGFSGAEALKVGALLGTKVTINELVAYSELVAAHLSERTTAIMTYALCGFSNFSCIGIQLGGIGALAPDKRVTLSELGLYAVLGGALANLLSASMAGLLL